LIYTITKSHLNYSKKIEKAWTGNWRRYFLPGS
jgi:hypothetical protein